MYQINFSQPIFVHFIGIGGISMSGLASVLLKEGFTVSGSDQRRSSLTELLSEQGARIFYGQSADNIDPACDENKGYTDSGNHEICIVIEQI